MKIKKNRHKNESSSNEKFLDFEQLEIANLWQVYEKSIEIGKKPDQERFTSLKIPSLILLYELVNCAEMKTSEMGKNEAVVAQRQNAKILENLCELIDGKSETSTNADDKKSPPPGTHEFLSYNFNSKSEKLFEMTNYNIIKQKRQV